MVTMVSKTSPPKDSKLVFLPDELVERVKEISIRKGTSITLYATEAIEQALRMEQLNATIEEAVNMYQQYLISQASGSVQIPRSQLDNLVKRPFRQNKENLTETWKQAGRWYGEYIKARLGDEALSYLRESLQVSWNLDEVSIQFDDLNAEISFTSFVYTEPLTHLLNSYIDGIMDSLEYTNTGIECLRGLSTLKYAKKN